MKFRLYKEFGALNSGPVFSAFEEGLKKLGLPVSNDADSIPVIWSVLWRGKMFHNKEIYFRNIPRSPVVILEIGNLLRGNTWRVSINNVNRSGYFGNHSNLDWNRHKKLNIDLKDINNNRRPEILITGQHEQSLQWEGQPAINKWVYDTVNEIKKYTDRRMYFRSHPRYPISINISDLFLEVPKKLPDSQEYDFNSNFHCVVNYNSGPGITSVINGTPVVVDQSSLAFPVSEKMKNIDNPVVPDRSEWFVQLCHTEWTVEEIADGIPLKRILPEIEKRLS